MTTILPTLTRAATASAAAMLLMVLAPLAAFASGFTVITPPPNAAVAAPPTNAPPIYHWDLREFPSCRIPYRVHNAGAAALGYASTATQVANAFAQWAAVSPATIGFFDNGGGAGTATRAAANDNENCVFWDVNLCSGDAWDPGLRGGAVGITALNGNGATLPATATGILTNVDIIFDDQHFVWSATTQSAPSLTNGDDAMFIENAGGGTRRVVIADGGNGRCESQAVCNDVQVVPVGPCAANAVLIRPAAAPVAPPNPPTPLAGSVQNLSGTMDVWNIAAHEIGHFCGLGENNANTAGFGLSETLRDGPFTIPAGGTLTFTINGNPVAVNLTQGNRTAAQVVAEINAAIAAQAAGQANGIVGPTGSVEIRGNALATDLLVVTGGTAAAALGMLTGETGASTMNQSPVGLVRLDQRTLSRHDWDGLNFLYTHDLGDAPDGGDNRYQSLVHGNANSRMLSGAQLTTPLAGALHLFGWPPFRWEWLGPNMDGNSAECEARVADIDEFDDGVSLPAGKIYRGENNRIVALVSFVEPGGRFVNAAASRLYFNGYIDLDLSRTFDPGERIVHWSGVPGTTNVASGNFIAGQSNLASNPMVLVFEPFVPAGPEGDSMWVRGRLDRGEDEGRAFSINGDLGPAIRVAQFGEVEDYRYPIYERVFDIACSPNTGATHAQPVTIQVCVNSLSPVPLMADYQFYDTKGWLVPPTNGTHSFPPVGNGCFEVTVRPPQECVAGESDTVCFEIWPHGQIGNREKCCIIVTCTQPTATLVSRFDAAPSRDGVELRFDLVDERGSTAAVIDRAESGDALTRVTPEPIVLDGRGRYTFVDAGVRPDAEYRYTLRLVGDDGAEVEAAALTTRTPRAAFALGRPQPNPTAAGFSVQLVMPRHGLGRVRVFDLAGRLVAVVHDGWLAAGEQTLHWDGRNHRRPVGNGVYLVEFEADGRRASHRVAVMR